MTIENDSFHRSPGGAFIKNDAGTARKAGSTGGELQYTGFSTSSYNCACANGPCPGSGAVQGTSAEFAWFDDPAEPAEGLIPAGRLVNGTTWTGATSADTFTVGAFNCSRRYFFGFTNPPQEYFLEDYAVFDPDGEAEILIRDRQMNFYGAGRHRDRFYLVDDDGTGPNGLGFGPVGEIIT